MPISKRLSVLLLTGALTCGAISATNNGFLVRHIRVQGLQHIDEKTVLHYLPIRQGQYLQPDDTGSIVSALYATGFFSNVSLGRQGDTLIINVQERPTIGSIKFSGNKKVSTKKLQEVLKNIGIQEGNTFDDSVLVGLQQSLQEQYDSLGQFGAKVTATAQPQSRNRVAIDIKIDEGKPTHIKSIKIVGNRAFGERRLLFQLKETTWRPWTILTHSDQYSEDKLNADLDTLRSYYMDRGYARFKINSAQAIRTPDGKDVNIVIDIDEGPIYRIQGYELTGNLLGQEATLKKSIPLKPGEVFSRQKILNIDTMINHFYGDQGYAFSNVNPVPTFDDVNHRVFITFHVDSGRRVYVRNINFSGNTKTQDIVLRRQMRQEEGALYSLSNIELGKQLLQLLGYLQNVNVKTTPVPGSSDLVDLTYDVQEMSSATASLQAGYSDMYGFLYGANLTENNWLGTGKQVSLGFQNSQSIDTYSFTYANPYYTESGVSRAFTLFAQHVTPINTVPYTSDIYGGSVTYGWPISNFSGLTFGFGYQYIDINPGNPVSTQVSNFLNQHGRVFNQTSLTGGWSRTTYDRALFPTRGTRQAITAEVGAPIFRRNLEYYRLNYQAGWYQPLFKGFIFHLNGDLGYGNSYGAFGTDGLPFFKNYYAGGIDSVRGYDPNTLGPVDSLQNPLGGNVLATASASVIIPNPISNKFRPSLFVDAGNVFANQFSASQIRYSTGIGIEVYIPMVGALQFAVSAPINPSKTDQTRNFDFSVGTSF